ncbi:MATE family efflux transporter [Butyrivibrio sp. AE3009]|uniref:MATE family efflux transporter n=1 Tax=Butyrivibrio sp. AE3009 TaxID=1280666 RepID=UPI0003B3C546|nr:MATE family efflux transporter [Butyrivibrio sp. AE3009]
MKKQEDIKREYLKLLPVQIIGILVSATNALIDSVITGRYIGSEALGAIGLFAPVISAVGFFMILITGFEILCSNAMGKKDSKEASALFSTCIFMAALLCILSTAICILFRAVLSQLLGADESSKQLLMDYISGYSLGFVGDVLCAIFMIFLPLNDDTKKSYFGLVAMISSNIILDLVNVLVLDMGTFGMGLASSVSYLLSAAIMLPGFTKSGRLLKLGFKNLKFKDMPEAIRLGSPNLMFTLGTVVKAYVFNRVLVSSFGIPAIATANVQGTLCSFLGAIPQGCAGAFLFIGSMYYGSKDKKSFTQGFSFAMKIGAALSATAAAVLMIFSGMIASFYFDFNEEAYIMTRDMLLVFPSFLIFNTALNLLLKVYQSQGKITLVNVFSIAENLMIAGLAVVLIKVIGINGAWIAFPLTELLCILLVCADIVFNGKKGEEPVREWISVKE